MEKKRGLFLTSFITGRAIVTIHLLAITFGLSKYNFNFGKTYNFISPCKFVKKRFFL